MVEFVLHKKDSKWGGSSEEITSIITVEFAARTAESKNDTLETATQLWRRRNRCKRTPRCGESSTSRISENFRTTSTNSNNQPASQTSCSITSIGTAACF